jgi:tRNA(fMet)-specific endonuclease VapC
MPRYLLDTSIVSAIADDPFGAVAARVTRHGSDRMCTSIVVAAELRFGAAKKGSKRLLHRIETALGNLDVQPFAAPADQRYADLRADLERRDRC